MAILTLCYQDQYHFGFDQWLAPIDQRLSFYIYLFPVENEEILLVYSF